MQEFFYAHPRGWANPVTMRADDTLPAAGAWDTGEATNIWTATGVTLAFTYERGAAGGAFDWQIELSVYSVAGLVPAGSSEWITEAAYRAGALAAGSDVVNFVQRDYQTYTSTGAGDEDFSYILELPTPVERIRILVRESGATGNPGDLNVTMIVRG
jgi:hypothetical protein